MYRVLRSVLFRLDPELAHETAVFALRHLPAIGQRLLQATIGRVPQAARIQVLGLDLASPVGLAAGFDKNAVAYESLAALGFAFVEVGTVTGYGQNGNPRPRMFRLAQDRALINRMGFNNHGCDVVRARVSKRRRATIGINIGKTKRIAADLAANDYVRSARALGPHADYMVINVSSPNTPGLRDLQATEKLIPIARRVRAALNAVSPLRRVPLLVKIAPDLAAEDIDAVADLAVDEGLDGIIATNTTVNRDGLATSPDVVASMGNGGLSGPPLKARALAVTRRLRRRLLKRNATDQVVLVAVGGIETAEDAWAHIKAGASLVQVYTAFIYEGPRFASNLARELVACAAREGFANVCDGIGADDPVTHQGKRRVSPLN